MDDVTVHVHVDDAAKNKFKHDALILYNYVYVHPFKFPRWTIEAIYNNFDTLMKNVTVYYARREPEWLIRKLITEREPVNIEGRRLFNTNAMNRYFGWNTSFYTRFYRDNGYLAPNIAVYTPALVKIGRDPDLRLVHIINSIGYAFDSHLQPDYKHLLSNSSLPKEVTRVLVTRYIKVFKLIYACAADRGMDTVVMSLVGADNFASRYKPISPLLPARGEDKRGNRELPAHAFQREVWVPAFVKAESDARQHTRRAGAKIKTVFMGAAGSAAFKLLPHELKHDIGMFPDNITRVSNLRTTLFVNSWDPMSFPGNGNGGDQSLDGFMGRSSTIALTGNGVTNPYIRLAQV